MSNLAEDLVAAPVEAQAVITSANLVYVSDEDVGIRRRCRGKGFTYSAPNGEALDKQTRARIDKLAIPPAWRDVWICTTEDGHLQATGIDGKGRKQYIYHERWQALRQQHNFEELRAFGLALPAIRQGIERDLRRRGLCRERVLALAVDIIQHTLIRVGNPRSALENRTFGLTTLRNKHLEIQGNHIRFHFRGKSNKEHDLDIYDPRAARLLRQCQQLPGQRLFQYVDEEGRRQPIDSRDVNDYLKDLTGAHFTAKDFRTWGGTVAALEFLLMVEEPAHDERLCKRHTTAAIKHAAQSLGNTISVCRRHYVHPAVCQAYAQGLLSEQLEAALPDVPGLERLQEVERKLLGLLHHLHQQKPQST
jgi:DNA topoisomerase-1